MKRIFLSYRRDDDPAFAGRLYDHLCGKFGKRNVFRDIDSIPAGADFRGVLADHFGECGVLIAVIGRRWTGLLQERAAAGTVDYVRAELDAANARAIPIIPVLAGDTPMPGEADLPPALQWLAARECVQIDPGKDYAHHIQRLSRAVRARLGHDRRWLIAAGIAAAVLAGVGGWLIGRGTRPVEQEPASALTEQARAVGLEAIEDRNDPVRTIPPEEFIKSARGEVFVSGLTCYRTFDQHKELIPELLALNRHLYFLILDPDAPDVAAIALRHSKNIKVELNQVVDMIKGAGYHRRPNFHLRFTAEAPPFTAVMVDGDVAESTTPPTDKYGRIRVQPGSAFSGQHKGIIFTFAKTREGTLSGFDAFSQDLRKQWKAAEESDAKVKRLFDAP